MKVTAEKNEQVANMIFASIYPLYWNRLEKNGRTKEEFHQVLEWLTGFNEDKIQTLIAEKVTFNEFEVYKQCRQMEKLIDELAKGRKMEKILRKEKTASK